MWEWVVLSFIGCIWKSSLAKVLLRSQKLTGSNHSPEENLLAKHYLPILGDEGWVRETVSRNTLKSPARCRVKAPNPANRDNLRVAVSCAGGSSRTREIVRKEHSLPQTPCALQRPPAKGYWEVKQHSKMLHLCRLWERIRHVLHHVVWSVCRILQLGKKEQKLWATLVPPEPALACA